MTYKIVYRFNAKFNVVEAKKWYKQQQPGLDKKFSASIKEAIVRLHNNPEVFAVRYKNVRIAHTNTFPFSIHFYVDKINHLIVITNILHDKRDFTV